MLVVTGKPPRCPASHGLVRWSFYVRVLYVCMLQGTQPDVEFRHRNNHRPASGLANHSVPRLWLAFSVPPPKDGGGGGGGGGRRSALMMQGRRRGRVKLLWQYLGRRRKEGGEFTRKNLFLSFTCRKQVSFFFFMPRYLFFLLRDYYGMFFLSWRLYAPHNEAAAMQGWDFGKSP